jgi:hypothetical protein
VDAGYRGEIQVCLVNHDLRRPVLLRRGDRVAQLVIQRVELPAVRVVDELPASGRGAGGFGSTGGWGGSADGRSPRGDVDPPRSRIGHEEGIEYPAHTADAHEDEDDRRVPVAEEL